MELLILLGVCLLLWFAYSVIREMDADARIREDDRFMAAYEREEEARALYYRLVAIERTRQNAIQELRRIATEAKGEVIDDSCREVERRLW